MAVDMIEPNEWYDADGWATPENPKLKAAFKAAWEDTTCWRPPHEIAFRAAGNDFEAWYYGTKPPQKTPQKTPRTPATPKAAELPTPRAQDLEQLSSVGHGRIREVVGGVTVYEAWYRHGKLHSEHGAALIRRDPASGAVIEECWMTDGKLQRATAPAWIQRDAKTGVATMESWWWEGQRDRYEDKPAETRRDAVTGQVISEAWYIEGVEIKAGVRAFVGALEKLYKTLTA